MIRITVSENGKVSTLWSPTGMVLCKAFVVDDNATDDYVDVVDRQYTVDQALHLSSALAMAALWLIETRNPK